MTQQQEASPQPSNKLKLMSAFDSPEDPRRRLANCDYPLQELLLTALCAISSGADDWVDVALWGEEKLDWLRRFLRFENGITSHDTFSRVFALLDAKGLEACFIDWMERLCPSLQGHAIHIDGKSLRGSHNGCQAMAHLVSAWDSAAGVTLGQVKTASRSNEITAAIPQLLNLLDVHGATVTIDAMGCQREIVKQIIDQGADFIIAVKNNQPTLAQAVELAFQGEAQGLQQGRLQQDITITKDHGRLETRRCVVTRDLSTLSSALKSAWPGIRSLVMVHSQRESTSGEHNKGEASSEWRYYLSSRNDIAAADFNQQIRLHWAIENGCHWVLDVNFREDDCRIRVGHGAENFAILRRMTLNLINNNTTIKASKKSKRNLAAWSASRLQELQGLQDLVAQEEAATTAA